MPTYFCYTRRDALTPEQRSDLAARITHTHTEVTGAPHSFSQVAFRELESDSHFVGGRPADKAMVWLYGHIRAGRPAEMKERLMVDLRDHLMAVTGAEERLVWVYVNELAPTDMIEFGHVLPAHGMEQEWFDALPSDLRAWLLTFGKPSPRFTL